VGISIGSIHNTDNSKSRREGVPPIARSAGGQLVQEIFSLEFVSKRRSQGSEDGGVCQRPGEIVERAKRGQIVHEGEEPGRIMASRRWTVFARRAGEKQKKERQRIPAMAI